MEIFIDEHHDGKNSLLITYAIGAIFTVRTP